jgi:ATP-dependent Clp protease adaptor protein ClpS
MTDTITKPKIQDEIKVERPRLHKVILLNDDFTPREFVVTVLNAKFRMSEDQARRVMMLIGAARVSSPSTQKMWQKPKQPMRRTRSKGYPLLFTTEPEE